MRRAILALLLTGCSYDWAVSAEPPSDSGRDVAPADVLVADAADAQTMDAAMNSDASDGEPIDSSTGGEGAAPDCAQRKQTMDDDFYAAINCPGGCTLGVCMASVTDPCNCTVHVCDGMSGATAAYKAAVTAFLNAGCLSLYAPCGDTCPLTGTSCSLGDAANVFACYY